MIEFLQIDSEIFPMHQVTRFKPDPHNNLMIVAGGKLYQGFDLKFPKFQTRLEEAMASGCKILTIQTKEV